MTETQTDSVYTHVSIGMTNQLLAPYLNGCVPGLRVIYHTLLWYDTYSPVFVLKLPRINCYSPTLDPEQRYDSTITRNKYKDELPTKRHDLYQFLLNLQ